MSSRSTSSYAPCIARRGVVVVGRVVVSLAAMRFILHVTASRRAEDGLEGRGLVCIGFFSHNRSIEVYTIKFETPSS